MTEWVMAFNERFALWTARNVGTMACAYVFAIIALIAFPQAVHDTFAGGFQPMPLVTWLSQSFLQLTLLAVIMVGQDVQARSTQKMATEQYNAVMEMLTDIREAHDELQVILKDVTELVDQKDTSNGRR